MRRIPPEQRRARLVRRHLLDGSGAGPRDVVAALVVLHATDPASVVLSVLARSAGTSIADVRRELVERRTLVRWMAMRRTLFVLAREDVPTVQAAVSDPLAAALRRRLLSRIARNGIAPAVEGDPGDWLQRVEDRTEEALRHRGDATGAELRRDVPELAAVIRAGAPSERDQAVASPLLTLLGTRGRIVRGAPIGAWTTRNHRWEPVEAWWPQGLPALDPATAAADLARHWLERFGPASPEDLEWWTGWNRTTTRAALAALDLEEVDLAGRPGVVLAGDADEAPAAPVATLLPALDPTPMGWLHRDWFTAVDRALLHDRAGNVGPTVWWDGELVGGWASTPEGVRVAIEADRGREAAEAVESAAAALEQRLEGAVVTPAARTPLERRLSG